MYLKSRGWEDLFEWFYLVQDMEQRRVFCENGMNHHVLQ